MVNQEQVGKVLRMQKYIAVTILVLPEHIDMLNMLRVKQRIIRGKIIGLSAIIRDILDDVLDDYNADAENALSIIKKEKEKLDKIKNEQKDKK